MTRWGGGVSPSQKTVKLGDNYGDLPVPTKTGYTFLGWRGKNLLNLADHNETFTNTYYIQYATDVVLIAGKTYTLSFDYTINSTTSYAVAPSVGCGPKGNYTHDIAYGTVFPNHLSGRSVLTFTPSSDDLIDKPYLAVRLARFGSPQSINVDILNIQLELGSEETGFEPYYVTNTSKNTVVGNRTLTADWNINYYTSDLNIYNPSGVQDYASGTCNITYVRSGTTYASGTDLTNENWDCSAALFPYETIITVSNIKSLGEWDITRVVIGGQTITGSNGVYTAKMTGSANVELYTTYWPDLPSSAGATFVNTQALQDSSGGRGKRVVQINTTKNASGTARTYKYSWDGSNWSNGASLVEKTSQGDQTLYVRVYPTGGEHYRGYVQTSTVVHLNKLPQPNIFSAKQMGISGYWNIQARRRVNTATFVCWAVGGNVDIYPATEFNDDSVHNLAGWSGWLISITSETWGYAYHYKNGFIDSDQLSLYFGKNDSGTRNVGETTNYTTTDDGQIKTA